MTRRSWKQIFSDMSDEDQVAVADGAAKRAKRSKTLRRSLLLKLADRMRRIRHKKHYDQGTWVELNSCGTSACLAGHLLLDQGYTPMEIHALHSVGRSADMPGRVAARIAGLSTGVANKLFCGLTYYPSDITSQAERNYPESWPQTWREAFRLNPDKRTKIAAALVEAVVKNGGKMPKTPPPKEFYEVVE